MSPDPREEPGDRVIDPITSFLDGIADSWGHALSGAQRCVEGTYTVSDVFSDVIECSMRASRLSIDLARGFGVLPPAAPARPNPTTVTVELPVHPSNVPTLTAGTLTGGELRAIGFGELFKIPADKVGVGPPIPQQNGLTTVRVAVDFAGVSEFERKRTIIYEGTITAPPSATGTSTTYRVRVPKPAS